MFDIEIKMSLVTFQMDTSIDSEQNHQVILSLVDEWQGVPWLGNLHGGSTWMNIGYQKGKWSLILALDSS